jgi:hypothetical protein
LPIFARTVLRDGENHAVSQFIDMFPPFYPRRSAVVPRLVVRLLAAGSLNVCVTAAMVAGQQAFDGGVSVTEDAIIDRARRNKAMAKDQTEICSAVRTEFAAFPQQMAK